MNSQEYKIGYLFGSLSRLVLTNIDLDDYTKIVNDIVDECEIDLDDKLVYKICELWCGDVEVVFDNIIAVGEDYMRYGYVELCCDNYIKYYYDNPYSKV